LDRPLDGDADEHGTVPELLRYTAFSSDPAGGNPAGVVLDATGLTDQQMLAIAAELGFSETAFLTPDGDATAVRYFSPLAEVSFCGHATIAAAVAHAHRHGPGTLRLRTSVGLVPVVTRRTDEAITATLTSVVPETRPLAFDVLDRLLVAIGWTAGELDPAIPPVVAYAGAWHPILAVRRRERLRRLDHNLDALARLAAQHGWSTVDLVWRESPTLFHARNPFPAGGVREDPATGAAAAALGGYLRERGLVELPARLVVLQGQDLGRPSVLTVEVPIDPSSGVMVTGTAVPLPEHQIASPTPPTTRTDPASCQTETSSPSNSQVEDRPATGASSGKPDTVEEG
jgi:PhzF family phenazine biosynthesis protein